MPNGLKLTTLLLLALAAAQQQQQPQKNGYRSSPREKGENAALRPNTLKPSGGLPLRLDTSTFLKGKQTSSITDNKRAVATLAPAGLNFNPAVRAPSARSAAGPSGGLTTPPRARSLQDWEVENFVLLATVDGSIYARDRNSGKELWNFNSERPMVETIYHRRNQSRNEGNRNKDDYMWIVEPNEDGSLYVFIPGPDAGIQKLGMTVKQLAEVLSPYASEDSPFVFTAEKRNTLFTLNATNGAALKYFSAGGPGVTDQKSCRINRLELDEDEHECEPTPTLHLGRTEYTVGIQDRVSGEDVCTIRYFEWTANNRDRDLAAKYFTTMDHKYIYSRFDGGIFAMDHAVDKEYPVPLYQKKAKSPVVRVFDVVRPHGVDSRDVPLVLLPQPLAPVMKGERAENVFVNCTESGSWYAMSEASYPSVTDGASEAKCYQPRNDLIDDASFWDNDQRYFKPSQLIGVHVMADEWRDQPQDIPTISPPENLVTTYAGDLPELLNETSPQSSQPRLLLLISSVLPFLKTNILQILTTLAVAALWWWQLKQSSTLRSGVATHTNEKSLAAPIESVQPDMPTFTTVASPLEDERISDPPAERKVRFAPTEEEQAARGETNAGEVAGESSPTASLAVLEVSEPAAETPKKRKAHRGTRGGRKGKAKKEKKEEDAADEEISRIMQGVIGRSQTMQPDQETFIEGNIDDVSDTVQINEQLRHTDRILGNGSGGTTVYEGTFEGREVAVKRMLLQYFDLASQEITLLSQSDDHPNVIRYYCHHKGKDFLYIAVERCQASLWDLYHDGFMNMDALKDEQRKIVSDINTSVAPALQQLAAGLVHLHSLRIIHRDIKPQNILITYPKKNQKGGPRLVISDFGLCRTLPENVSTLVGTMGNAGTIGWKAPELIGQPRNGEGRQSSNANDSTSSNETVSQGVKRAVDIFSLGCVFFYVLTNGFHPFDSDESEIGVLERELNIKKNVSNFHKLRNLGDEAEEPMQLINWMLAPSPENRPNAVQVANHPFFWSPAKRLNFLCDVSDHWEREQRDPPSAHLIVLEDIGHAKNIHYNDFQKQLDRKFLDTLGKQRKYTGDRMLDLLRALRNKKNHYADMPEEVQRKVGPLPEGYLMYWTRKFPLLLMGCYDAVRACGLEDDARFRPYLDAEGGVGS